jgi:nucleoside-diphosphate-sugar epimerase
MRPADVTLQIPCVDKFRRATGWKPERSFEDSLRDLLDHWRAEVAALPRDKEVRR